MQRHETQVFFFFIFLDGFSRHMTSRLAAYEQKDVGRD